jgi:hypothetical protein
MNYNGHTWTSEYNKRRRVLSSEKLCIVASARTDVSEAFTLSIISVERNSELGTTLAVTELILSTLMMEAICFSGTSALTRATRRHIPEDSIRYIHCREKLKSYIALTGWAL